MSKKIKHIHPVNSSNDIYMYGFIGAGMDIDAITIVKAIENLENITSEINIRINSYGGQVFEGLPIINKIKKCKAKINIFIDGIAASMAGVIALSVPPERLYMSRFSRIMLHKVTSYAEGTADDLISAGKMAQEMNDTIVKIVAEHINKDFKYVQDNIITNNDQWFNTERAIQEGFLPEENIYDGTIGEPENCIKPIDFYNHFTNKITENMKKIALFIAAFATAGVTIPQDADEDVILRNTQDVLNKNKDLSKQLQDAQARIAALENAEKEAKKVSIKNLLDKAIQEKRITEADRKSWETMFENSYDAACNALNSIPSQSIAAQLHNSAAAIEGREKWTWDDYSQKAPAELERMRNEKNLVFINLYKSKFGIEPKF